MEIDFVYQGKKPGGPPATSLKVNGEQVTEGKMKVTVAGRFGIDTF